MDEQIKWLPSTHPVVHCKEIWYLHVPVELCLTPDLPLPVQHPVAYLAIGSPGNAEGGQEPKTVKGAQSDPNYVSRLLLDCVAVFHKIITPVYLLYRSGPVVIYYSEIYSLFYGCSHAVTSSLMTLFTLPGGPKIIVTPLPVSNVVDFVRVTTSVCLSITLSIVLCVQHDSMSCAYL